MKMKFLHSSLSSIRPRDVIDNAIKNSSNSIDPSPFSSNRLKTNLKYTCYALIIELTVEIASSLGTEIFRRKSILSKTPVVEKT